MASDTTDETASNGLLAYLLCLLDIHQWEQKTRNHDPLNAPKHEEQVRVCRVCGVTPRW